jgi:hypothetical protein
LLWIGVGGRIDVGLLGGCAVTVLRQD